MFGAVAEASAHQLGHGYDSAVVLRYLGAERAVVVGVWRARGGRGLPVNAELDFDHRNSALGRVCPSGSPARADGFEGLPRQAAGADEGDRRPLLGGRADLRIGRGLGGAGRDEFTRRATTRGRLGTGMGDLVELAASAVAREQTLRRLEASRRRMVEEADAASRRLERELHEGTQQHLLALTLKLRMAHASAGPSSTVAELLDAAMAEAMIANEALRELSRGLYPVVAVPAPRTSPPRCRPSPRVRRPPCTWRSSPGAASRRSPRRPPISWSPKRCSAAPESTKVTVAVADRGELLLVEIGHEGIGASEARLRGLIERVAAVGGRVHIDRNSTCCAPSCRSGHATPGRSSLSRRLPSVPRSRAPPSRSRAPAPACRVARRRSHAGS